MENPQASSEAAKIPIPALPDIPERKHRYSTSQRRRSLPPLKPNKQPSPNNVQVAPASPEVISSLISSLSSFSSPIEEQVDGLPFLGSSKSTPSSPNAHQQTFPSFESAGSNHRSGPPTPRGGGFGVDYGAYTPIDPNGGREYLHPDEAGASSPVIRTAKPPSGFSPLTAENAGSASSLKSYLRGSGRPESPSSRSKSSRDVDEVSSIGSLSIEPGVAPKDSTSNRNSVGSDSKQSRRSAKGLMFMGSKERLREKEHDRKRTNGSADGLGLGLDGAGEGNSQTGPESLMVDTAINEEPSTGEEEPGADTSSPIRRSPSVGGLSPGLRSSSPGMANARRIPHRESSLRKTESPSRPKRASYQSSKRSSRHEATQGIKEEEDDEATKEKDLTTKLDEMIRERKPKHYPPALITSDPPMKLQSPLTSPSLPPPPSPHAPKDMSVNAAVQMAKAARVEEKIDGPVEESAPSPAIVQRKPRDSSLRVNSFTAKPSKTSRSSQPLRSPSLDTVPSMEPTPARTSSRLKRVSLPTSPSSDRHSRSFSNSTTPAGRNSESNVVRPPTLVVEERPSSADSVDDAVAAYTCSPRLSQKIRHPQTGRTISFSEVGDSQGFAVFCCVGMGLTRYITAFYDELALTLKLRLITPDRPGVGNSDPYNDGTSSPLSWPDDVYAICQALKITKFSILAHSAGAIYALATALRMPQHIRGRIHLLAPWIPPSQLSAIGSSQGPAPTGSVPTSQRILRALPTPILKAANSSFMSATSTSITSSLPKSPRRDKKSKRSGGRDTPVKRDSLVFPQLGDDENISPISRSGANMDDPNSEAAILAAAAMSIAEKERQTTYDERLTHAIWNLATTNANPAVDLLVCLERRQTIGFRYVDITRAVVIHHGSKDSRVPVENVRWLGKTMRRCEVRILEGEGHGLMASAGVMGGILMEVAKEWEDWTRVVNGERGSSKVSLVSTGVRASPRASPLPR